MATVPAILGTARLANFRLGYQTAALAAIRVTRVRITIAGALMRYRRGSVTIRDVINDNPNTCSLIVNSDTPPQQSQRIRITINSDSPRLLFSGALETIRETYDLKPEQIAYHCTAQDDTPRANRRIPLAYYAGVSATTVAQELVTNFAPGFTATNVQASLPTITVHFEGSEAGMNGCLRQIAKLIGGYFYWEDRDLHLFTTEATDTPDTLNSTPGRILDNPHIAVSRDDSQLRTRDFGKGHQEQTQVEVAVGANTIPLGDVSMYNALGGKVISESQILTYTGKATGGSGALVGTTVTPTNPPTFAPITNATGIDAGDHYWAYTFYDGTGETLPSPNSATFTSGGLVTPPSTAPTATRQRGGTLSVGNYQWKTAFVDSAGGITTVSPASSTVAMVNTPTAPSAMGTAGYTDKTGVAQFDPNALYNYGMTFEEDATSLESEMGPAASLGNSGDGVFHGFLLRSGTSSPPANHSRRFYRTEGGGSVYKRMPGPENGFSNDDGSMWWEGYADTELGVAAPTVAHYKQASLAGIPVSTDANVVSVNIYRTEANGSTFKLAGNVSNGTTTFNDNVADASLGATAPTSSTAVYRRANLSGIGIGPTGTTGRKVYRTAAGAAQLKLLTDIANNTATTHSDSAADSTLGANVPTSNTSGLVQETGNVAAGSTTLLITSTAPFTSTGGWAAIGNLPVRYTGFSSTALTGIPASGVGALTTSVRYGAVVGASPLLTGVTGIVRTLIKGAPIHIWVQRDDTAAQAELAAREGEGDGIIEYRIVDERRGEASLIALCDADLAQFSRPIVTVTGATRDVKMKSGKPLTIDISSPNIDETLVIQDVTITEIDIADRLAPKFTFTASSIRFSVEDLLRRMASSLEGV